MRNDDENHNSRSIGQHREELRGDAETEGLRVKLQDRDRAKQIATSKNPPRTPGGKDDKRQRDPAGGFSVKGKQPPESG